MVLYIMPWLQKIQSWYSGKYPLKKPLDVTIFGLDDLDEWEPTQMYLEKLFLKSLFRRVQTLGRETWGRK